LYIIHFFVHTRFIVYYIFYLHYIFYCILYISLYNIHFVVHYIFYCILYISLYIIQFVVHYICYCTLYVLLYIIHFIAHYTFYCILYIFSFITSLLGVIQMHFNRSVVKRTSFLQQYSFCTCALSGPHDGQNGWPKHVAGWNKSECGKFIELRFVWIEFW
jgi:hypothetical protein